MDTPTHMLLGGAFAYALLGPRLGRSAAVAGALGALAPDLDVFLAPLGDPALRYHLHRHFTHALPLAPLIGALAATPLLLLRRARGAPLALLAAGAVGCLTHGPLDQLTSYGTHLWWPFLAERTSWDAMPIVDPIFTLLLIAGLAAALWRARPRVALLALAPVLLYVGLGFLQRERAMSLQRTLAAERGDRIEHGRVLPTVGNLILWRSLYRTADGSLRADALRLPLWGEASIRRGEVGPRVVDLDPIAPPGSAARRRLDHFAGFADGFVIEIDAGSPDERLLADARFSLDTAGFRPLWGVRVRMAPEETVKDAGEDAPASEFAPEVAASGPIELTWQPTMNHRRRAARALLAEVAGTADGWVGVRGGETGPDGGPYDRIAEE
jgi:inner membrane protein